MSDVSRNPTDQRKLAQLGPQRHGEPRVDLNAPGQVPAIGKPKRKRKRAK